MQPLRSIPLIAALIGAPSAPGFAQGPKWIDVSIDLNQRADDLFRVRVSVSGLRPGNAIYQFPVTAPGTYQVMNVGRYVRSFHAFDAEGVELPVEQVSVNQWRLGAPERTRELRYTIAETWDTPVDRDRIYPMAGTSLEADHALINPHAVTGYFHGLQATPIRLRLDYPAGWTIGTPLERDRDGAYRALNFDHLVDSPLLLGRLTTARLEITGVPVEIYVYSRTDKISAQHLMDAMSAMLRSAGTFLGKLPVDRYTFLYHFENRSVGAWEHSQASEYVLREQEFTPGFGQRITDIAAHEFFHVVTPLNVHSEVIAHFNFVTPVPSQHLWLYEGTTEWAAHAMQLRSALVTPEQHLATILDKMRADRQFDSTYSLVKLALTSFSDSGQAQYANIYQRGALAAGLLDIRLLELSGGRRGLQDLINDLAKKYGKKRAFPEDRLFDVITSQTSPAIGDFFQRYVQRAEPLPIREYFAKLGIRLVTDSTNSPVRFELDPNATREQLKLRAAWCGKGCATRPTA
ncbi:MAG: peptidase [Gemmatimonadales bacterium]|nr:peptidase [Gemmatimonadales bacterium]